MDIREVVSAYYSIYEGKKKEEKEEKPEKWFDDDGDGNGYEKGEVDGKFDKKKKKKDEDEEEVDEGLEFVDDLTEEELDALVEETIEAYLEEGYDIDELDQIFVEYLEEAKVTYGHDSDGDDKGDDLVSAVKKRKDEKAAKNQKRVEKVKNAIKKQVGKVKQAASDLKSGETEKKVKAWAMEPATRRAAEKSKFNPTGKGLMPLPKKKNEKGELKHPKHGKGSGEKEGLLKKYHYADLRSRQLGDTKPEKAKKARREVRKAIVGDLKNRAKVGAYNLKRNVKADAKLRTDKAKSTIKGFVKKATSAPKRAAKAVSSAAGGAVKKVRNKTASALSSLADKIKTEGIELDAFDTVTAYLIDEGFATTFDEAQKIMTTLDSQLIEEVHEHQLAEAMLLTKADKVGNTPAWQNRDKKNVKTGEPIYKKADHLKKEDK